MPAISTHVSVWSRRLLVMTGLLAISSIAPATFYAADYPVPANDVAALINALNNANFTPEADTITLAANSTYVLTGANNDVNGLPVITSEITIEGNGSIIGRSNAPGTPNFRILRINPAGSLTLNNTGIYNGYLIGTVGGDGPDRPVAPPGQSGQSGGAGVSGGSVSGGGIYNEGSLTISGSTFYNNTAMGGSGGDGGNGGDGGDEVFDLPPVPAGNGGAGGSAGNGGFGRGGAIYSIGTLTIVNSTFAANRVIGGSAGSGGHGGNGGDGIFFPDGAGGNGADGGLPGAASGGAIYTTATVDLNNVTLVENDVIQADSGSGGSGGIPGGQNGDSGGTSVGSGGGALRVASGTLTLKNTLIASNTADFGGPDCMGSLTSEGHNFLANKAQCDGLIDHLQDDQVGGPGAPLDPFLYPSFVGQLNIYQSDIYSPVRDAGSNVTCATTDQIGALRPLIGRDGSTAICDIGAIEGETPPPNTPNFFSIDWDVFDVVLTWVDTSTIETGFRVERSQNNISWQVVDTLPAENAPQSSYTDTTVSCEMLYYYRIVAFNDAGDSVPMYVPVSITTGICPTVTPSSTPTSTATDTPPATDTATATATSAVTATPTGTDTATETATSEVTETATAIATMTATLSPGQDLILNGEFETAGLTEKQAAAWKGSQTGSHRRICKPEVVHSGLCAYQFKGDPATSSTLKQITSSDTVASANGDLLTLSLWAQAKNLTTTASVKVKIRYTDSRHDLLQVLLPSGSYLYQGFSAQKGLTGSVQKFKVLIKLPSGAGKLWIDSVQLPVIAASNNGLHSRSDSQPLQFPQSVPGAMPSVP